MKFEFSDHSLDKISSDAALVFALGDKEGYLPSESFRSLDELLAGQLTRVCDLEKFKGKKGETLTVIPALEILPSRIMIVGLGTKEEFTADTLRKAMGSVSKRCKGKIDSISMIIPMDLLTELDLPTAAQMTAEGLLLGAYSFNKYKEKKGEKALSSVIISADKEGDKKEIFDAVKRAELFSRATILARDLVNEPANEVTPTYLAGWLY